MKFFFKIKIPGIILGFLLCVDTCLSQETDIYIDNRDGRIYKTIKIADQIWFANNLKYIPVNDSSWSYDNNKSNEEKFGRLYTWNTAQEVCPSGWHLPDNGEWIALINFFGGKNIAGTKLKASYGWNDPESEELINKHIARPEYKDTLCWDEHIQKLNNGINIFPAGKRTPQGEFQHLGNDAIFWSSTAKSSTVGWKIRLNCNIDSVGMEPCFYLNALSVRCVKDK